MYKLYVLKRLAKGALTFIIIMFICSVLFNYQAETAVKAQVEEEVHRQMQAQPKNLSSEQIQVLQMETRARLYSINWLDRSYPERILFRTLSAVTFRFGDATSIETSKGERRVSAILLEALPRSMALYTTAVFFQIIIGIFLGMRKARKPGGMLDRSTTTVAMILNGIPVWWFGMMLIMLFVYGLKLFPSGGIHSVPPPSGIAYLLDMGYHMVLPLLTLLLVSFWSFAYIVRNIVVSTLQEDFIMSARARGIPEKRVLYGHAMRSAAPPLMTMTTLALIGSIGGSIIFEGIFSWPGLGQLYWVAVQQNDVPVLMGDLAVTIALYQLAYVGLDVIYGYLDPRIKVGG
ncbi:MAG: ABC transporter permease [Syntrophobacteraceae bacterium]